MLLTLEGLDGSGKTTCWEAIRDEFGTRVETDQSSLHTPGGSGERRSAEAADERGLTYTREPTDSWYGEAVQRSIADDDADPLAELFLYTADHAAHLETTVRPALSRGDIVVSDRYSDSRYAYQGATLADRFDDALAFVRSIHQPWTRTPDATIYLDIDPETGAHRSGSTNKFESRTSLAAVKENYERLIEAERERFICVDATQPEADVRATVIDAVETLL